MQQDHHIQEPHGHGVEESTLDWRTVLYRVLRSLPGLLISLFLSWRGGGFGTYTIVLVVIYFVLFLPGSVLAFWFFRYALTPDELRVTRGVFSRESRTIPYRRIQNVGIEQTLLARLLGIAKVTIETSGGGQTEATLEFVSHAEARKLSSYIATRKDDAARRAPDSPEQESADPAEVPAAPYAAGYAEEQAEEVIATPARTILLRSAASFNLAYLAAAVFFLAQLFEYAQLLLDRRTFSSQVSGGVEALKEWSIAYIAPAVLGALVLTWAISFVAFAVRYLGHTVRRYHKKIYAEWGLLSKKNKTVPFSKIQVVRLRTTLLMRLAGLQEVALWSAGGNANQEQSNVIVAFLRPGEVFRLPGVDRVQESAPELEPVSPKSIHRVARVMALRILFFTAAVCVPLGWWWSAGALALASLPAGYGYSYMLWKVRKYAVGQGGAVSVDGLLVRRTSYVEKKKVQAVAVHRSFFQRRLGLCTVHIHTASHHDGVLEIRDIDAEKGYLLAETLLQKQAR